MKRRCSKNVKLRQLIQKLIEKMQTVVEGYTLPYIQSEVILLGTKSDNDNNVVMLYWH